MPPGGGGGQGAGKARQITSSEHVRRGGGPHHMGQLSRREELPPAGDFDAATRPPFSKQPSAPRRLVTQLKRVSNRHGPVPVSVGEEYLGMPASIERAGEGGLKVRERQAPACLDTRRDCPRGWKE